MVKKMKCWRRFGKIGDVTIWRNFNDKKVTLRKIDKKYRVNTFSNGKKYFSSNSEALKFAKSYMKKHDVCQMIKG